MNTKNPIHRPEKKVGFFPPLDGIASQRTPTGWMQVGTPRLDPQVWLPYHMIMPKNLRGATGVCMQRNGQFIISRLFLTKYTPSAPCPGPMEAQWLGKGTVADKPRIPHKTINRVSSIWNAVKWVDDRDRSIASKWACLREGITVSYKLYLPFPHNIKPPEIGCGLEVTCFLFYFK